VQVRPAGAVWAGAAVGMQTGDSVVVVDVVVIVVLWCFSKGEMDLGRG
jgi:hypothetical protein